MNSKKELVEDMRSHMTIEEVLQKHNLSLKECCDLLYYKTNNRKNRKRKYRETGEPYIRQDGKRFHIRKKINGRAVSFGGYNSLEDAVKVRDYLMEHGWYRNRLKSTLKTLGVHGRVKKLK